QAASRVGALEQSPALSMQRLRRLFAGEHCFLVSGIAVRQKPAQRSVWRNPGRTLRGGWIRRLHLAASLRAAQIRGQGNRAAEPRADGPEPGAARHVRLGKFLAGPGSRGQTASSRTTETSRHSRRRRPYTVDQGREGAPQFLALRTWT